MTSSTTNSGKYILIFGTTIIVLNIILVIFLFLNEKGIIKFNRSVVETVNYETLPIVSSPAVSAPLSE